jgi:thioredoxin reductase
VPPSTPADDQLRAHRAADAAAAQVGVEREARRMQHMRHDRQLADRQAAAAGRYKSKKRRQLDEDNEEDGTTVLDDDENLTYRVRDDGGVYVLRTTASTTYRCTNLIVATGISQSIRPDIRGIELTESYSQFDTDPASFRNQSVLILGKGNSAFETASSLLEEATHIHVIGRSQLKFAHQTHYVGDLRAINDDLIDVYQLKSLGGVLDVHINRSVRLSSLQLTPHSPRSFSSLV